MRPLLPIALAATTLAAACVFDLHDLEKGTGGAASSTGSHAASVGASGASGGAAGNGGSASSSSSGCTAKTCASLFITCGMPDDGCGATVDCGGARDGQETDVDCGGPTATCPIRCAQGQHCAADSDCATSHCADGFCCDASCKGVCMSCAHATKVSGPDGTCGPTAAGHPSPGCADQGASSCGTDGFCTGSGTCERYPSGTQCMTGLGCSGGDQVMVHLCDAQGMCDPSTSYANCDPYACIGSDCLNSCTNDSQCSGNGYCSGGSCNSKGNTGDSCNADNQCNSGTCDGTGHCL